MSEITIVCHGENAPYIGRRPVWRQGDDPKQKAPVCTWCGGQHWGPIRTYRTCEYCGCIHPEDLLDALKAGATLGGSDWKYGWPHKFYVDAIPNPYPDFPIVIGSRSEGGVKTCDAPQPAGPLLRGKWYNEHLIDIRDLPLFAELRDLITHRAGIYFDFKDGELVYRAPHHGYQRY